jgi:TPR repeat protein
LEGAGTKQDYQKALEYTTKAANLGDKCSIANLGDIYELGRGVSPNKKLALEYYEKALSLGFESVRDKVLELKGITSAMTSSHSNIMTDEEQEYLEEVKICLEEDGEISPKERRLLDRLRTKLGISEIRAKVLEDSLNTLILTEEEQEYLEEYKLCLEEDGEISPKERRLLDRLRDKLSISQKRAKELEDFV